MAPFAPQPEAFVRATGRFAWLLIPHLMSLPSSGLAGNPSRAFFPNSPRWTAPTGPLALLPPYSQT